jgi:hypothetical protein
VRIRIALTTAVAVIAGMTTGIFTLSISRQPASARATTHHTAQAGGNTALSHTALAGFAIPGAVSPTTSTTTPPVTKAAIAPTPAPTPTSTPVVVIPPPPVTPPPPPPPPVTDATSVATADWGCIRVHESGDQYNSPAAPSGAYGILISTWRALGYSGWPYEAPASVQDQVALALYARYGWGPWSSRFACGL